MPNRYSSTDEPVSSTSCPSRSSSRSTTPVRAPPSTGRRAAAVTRSAELDSDEAEWVRVLRQEHVARFEEQKKLVEEQFQYKWLDIAKREAEAALMPSLKTNGFSAERARVKVEFDQLMTALQVLEDGNLQDAIATEEASRSLGERGAKTRYTLPRHDDWRTGTDSSVMAMEKPHIWKPRPDSLLSSPQSFPMSNRHSPTNEPISSTSRPSRSSSASTSTPVRPRQTPSTGRRVAPVTISAELDSDEAEWVRVLRQEHVARFEAQKKLVEGELQYKWLDIAKREAEAALMPPLSTEDFQAERARVNADFDQQMTTLQVLEDGNLQDAIATEEASRRATASSSVPGAAFVVPPELWEENMRAEQEIALEQIKRERRLGAQ